MPGASPLNVFENCQVAPFKLYSKVPTPVAFTTIFPDGRAQVGWVTVGGFTVGGTGILLIFTGFPEKTETQLGLLTNLTEIL